MSARYPAAIMVPIISLMTIDGAVPVPLCDRARDAAAGVGWPESNRPSGDPMTHPHGTFVWSDVALRNVDAGIAFYSAVFGWEVAVVDALGGAPGIYSARFAGEDATDEANNTLLLEKLDDVPTEKRTAHYVCHMALADPAGVVCAEANGRCHGRIRREAAGSGGFGYDPLFEIVEYHRTFGELGAAVKAALSHRARAMRAFIPHLVRMQNTGTSELRTAQQ